LDIPQLMPLQLTVSCFSKIQIGVTFLVPAHLGSPGQRAVNRMYVCMYVCYSEQHNVDVCGHYVVLIAAVGVVYDVRCRCNGGLAAAELNRTELRGARQQTRRTPPSIDGTDRRIDGRTLDRFVDPAPQTTRNCSPVEFATASTARLPGLARKDIDLAYRRAGIEGT